MKFDEIPPCQGLSAAPATPDEMEEIFAEAARLMPLEAALEAVLKVQSKSQSILAIRQNGKACGCFAGLFLNEKGRAALIEKRLSVSDPSLDHLAGIGLPAAAIYFWGIYGPGNAAGNVIEWLQRPAYRHAPIFARPVTPAGLAFMIRGGGVSFDDDLWVYERVQGGKAMMADGSERCCSLLHKLAPAR
jgi:hypothetical protein